MFFIWKQLEFVTSLTSRRFFTVAVSVGHVVVVWARSVLGFLARGGGLGVLAAAARHVVS